MKIRSSICLLRGISKMFRRGLLKIILMMIFTMNNIILREILAKVKRRRKKCIIKKTKTKKRKFKINKKIWTNPTNSYLM
jgi:DNA polymerase IIIc chi subunit